MFRLKRPRRGVREIVFEPAAFMARLAALVAPPMQNQLLYFGALGSGSPIRSEILPVPPESTPQRPTAPARPQRMSHRDLLIRVFEKDLYQCPCGGRLELLAVIVDPDVVQAILAAIVLSTQLPTRASPVGRAR